jgi:hypothetical protein
MALKPKTRTAVTLPEYHPKTKPFDHQTRAFNRSRNMPLFALLWEVGCAKSKVILDTAADNYERGTVDTLLVLAPNRVHRAWVTEQLPEHMPERIPHVGAYWRSGYANKEFNQAVQETGKLRVISINLEVMSNKKLAEMVYEIAESGKTMVALDESHNFKTPAAKRTHAVWKLRKYSVMRRILTGTEIGLGYEDLYAQYSFLDPSIIGVHTYTEFKNTYCITDRFNQVLGYKNVEELQERIAPYTDFADKATSLDLPPELDLPPYDVPLSDEQWRVYNELRELFLAELRSGAIIEAPLAINRILKFRQIAAGHVALGQGKWEPLDAGPRIDIVLDILRQARGQTIVWCQFQPDIIQVSAGLAAAGVSHVTYYGGNTGVVNDRNLDKFKADPTIKVFLATVATGGEGLTINQADTVIRYNLGDSFLKHTQATGRNYRPGQTKSVTRHTLIARRTIEVKLAWAIKHRKELRELFRNPEVYRKWLMEVEE